MNILGKSQNPIKNLILKLADKLSQLSRTAVMEKWLPSKTLIAIKANCIEVLSNTPLTKRDFIKFCKSYFSLPDTSKPGITLSKLVDPFNFLLIQYIEGLFNFPVYLPTRENPSRAEINSAKQAYESATVIKHLPDHGHDHSKKHAQTRTETGRDHA